MGKLKNKDTLKEWIRTRTIIKDEKGCEGFLGEEKEKFLEQVSVQAEKARKAVVTNTFREKFIKDIDELINFLKDIHEIEINNLFEKAEKTRQFWWKLEVEDYAIKTMDEHGYGHLIIEKEDKLLLRTDGEGRLPYVYNDLLKKLASWIVEIDKEEKKEKEIILRAYRKIEKEEAELGEKDWVIYDALKDEIEKY